MVTSRAPLRISKSLVSSSVLISEDVVAYQEAFEVLGRRVVVEPEDVDAAGDMTGDVVGEGHVPHGGPGRGAAVVADRELDGEADLSGHPDVLEDVAVHEDALGILELEEVLDHPQDAGVAGIFPHPRQRLEEVVVPDLDVRRDEIRDAGARAAKEDVLAGRFEIVA